MKDVFSVTAQILLGHFPKINGGSDECFQSLAKFKEDSELLNSTPELTDAIVPYR